MKPETTRMVFTISTDQKEQLEKRANKQGVSISNYLRQLIAQDLAVKDSVQWGGLRISDEKGE